MPGHLVIVSASESTEDKLLRAFMQAVRNRATVFDTHGVNSPEWVEANAAVVEIRKMIETNRGGDNG